MLSDKTMNDLFIKKNMSNSQVETGVKRVVFSMVEYSRDKKLGTLYGIKSDDALEDYGFLGLDIAEIILKLEMKYELSFQDNYKLNMTFGELVNRTADELHKKHLEPKTNNDVYFIFNKILSNSGINSNFINRDHKLKEYKIDFLNALALIQKLENMLGLAPESVSSEIEAKFKSKKYNYYNQISINEIVRIAWRKYRETHARNDQAMKNVTQIKELINGQMAFENEKN